MLLAMQRSGVDGNTRLVMIRGKVTVEIQDGWRKDAGGIRNVEKQ